MKSVDLDPINPTQQTQVQKPGSPRPNVTDISSPIISSGTDQISGSQHVEEVSRLIAHAADLTEVRQDRVDLFKRLIDSGRYHRSSRVIAEAIVANEE
jgi:anti-sigma28 factor (negative regulator of flagellin synthesis)